MSYPGRVQGPHRETADHRPLFVVALGPVRAALARLAEGAGFASSLPSEWRRSSARLIIVKGIERHVVKAARNGGRHPSPGLPHRSGPGRGAATPGIPRARMAGVETWQRADRAFSGRGLRRAGLRLCSSSARCPAGANAMSMLRLAHADDRTGVRRSRGGHGAGQIRAGAKPLHPFLLSGFALARAGNWRL
ncbi:hypothetical protein M2324_003292 [Rhodovulum sulfidophilum]|uniref:hypothetical protein n=1 Tax=Rhodovulum sulfidophilum TaxID=35806 RepID=UPI0005A7AA91|nr:hypothetical protein [Rhodovulum sulfidophilum]ANB33475.1 hypothetical protein A6W98_04955 [Rhodovulum sulfidophilum DSM 1374]ANB37296.1 hypothetical protein A6024_04805 [Rhodovulum sulfidophilum]MCW2304878.1 hypothetical protein [Rhodovulum sulfidophilum]